jgi:hypothetical protein
MNERIKQLSDIAYQNHLKNNPNSSFSPRADYVKEFAELIVGECIRKIEDIAESSNDPQPIYRVAVELLEHFGVEE